MSSTYLSVYTIEPALIEQWSGTAPCHAGIIAEMLKIRQCLSSLPSLDCFAI
jgi:hypothetical protein